jgi:hypothetical protein
MKRMRAALGARWSWIAAGVTLAGFVAVSAVMARAQSRGSEMSDVTIRRIEVEPGSRPLPVQPIFVQSTLERGGLYEIYFNGNIDMPVLGARHKLFVHVVDVSPDGWVRVAYGDNVDDKGSLSASLDEPVILPIEGQVPPVAVEFNLHYSMIAATSVRLNANGDMAKYWPE